MFRDYVGDLLQASHVHVRDKSETNKKINEIINGGAARLQIVTDFDQTITKQHEYGKKHLSSFGIFAKCKSLPKSYLEACSALFNKYYPIEVDPTIPLNEKKVLMEEWYRLSEEYLMGLIVPNEDIDEVVLKEGPDLRDGCQEAFKNLNAMNVPVLVFSAGLGDAVLAVLKHANVLLENVKVISNFLKRDEGGVVQGFGDRKINVFNKNEHALEGTEYYDLVRERGNIILMGDSLGDAVMAEGVPHSNAILKIGFLYDNAAGNLPNYLESFDIVLEDDQTMNVLNSILNLIKTSK